ncbi:hypothetical protein [Halobacillus sp. Marseille-Q1614]|uniref:hypothetical protein n=1 Tax=Halobacillus sp. Marseille-Q1614 TaxID=2709134 RepID=UPI0015715C54|nr:hypothetical protein [Halobacillus sp. Marseille-Q1614]
MKGLLVFLISFIVLYSVFQSASGLLLTALHISEAFGMTSFIEFGYINYIPFAVSLLSAVLAYVFSSITRMHKAAANVELIPKGG